MAYVLFGGMKFGWKYFRVLKPYWLHRVQQEAVCLTYGSNGM